MKKFCFCGQNLLLLFLACVALISLYKYIVKHKNQNNIEHFAICTNEKDYSGNPMTLRDGTNISYSPELTNGIDPKNAILGYKSGNVGWEGKKDEEYLITFKNPRSLKGIIIGGYGSFNIFVDVYDPVSKITQWYPVYDTLRTDNNDIFSSGETSVAYTTQKISSCFNIEANKTTDIICKRIKFRVMSSNPVKAQFEAYGMELDASPAFKDAELLNKYTKVYDENNELAKDSEGSKIAWQGETINASPFFKVQFASNETVPIANKLIYYIDFSSYKNTWITSYHISHKYNGSDVIRHVSDIVGNAGNSDKVRHYFKYPILASELTIKPSSTTDFDSAGDSNKPACQLEIFGRIIKSVKEESTLKSEQETYYQINASQKKEETCPPIGQLIGKQAEIQQLCSALEQSDEIEYEKKKIDKNRLYLIKLEKQKKEIKELENMIKKMRDANKYFDQIEDRNKLAMVEYQENLDKKLKELTKERLAKQTAINFNLAVKDAETNIKPSATEGFQNRVTNFMSDTFQNYHITKAPPKHFYEEFVGNPYKL